MKPDSRIRQYRLAAGLSVSELSRRLKVSVTAAANWDHGNTMPRAENLKAIAEALGVTPELLIEEPGAQHSMVPGGSVGDILGSAKAKLATALGLPQNRIRLELRIEE